MTPRMKASVDDVGARGVAIGGAMLRLELALVFLEEERVMQQ